MLQLVALPSAPSATPILTPATLNAMAAGMRYNAPLPDTSMEAVVLMMPEALDALIALLLSEGMPDGVVLRSLALMRYDLGAALDALEERDKFKEH